MIGLLPDQKTVFWRSCSNFPWSKVPQLLSRKTRSARTTVTKVLKNILNLNLNGGLLLQKWDKTGTFECQTNPVFK
jgi:hypothetical protein